MLQNVTLDNVGFDPVKPSDKQTQEADTQTLPVKCSIGESQSVMSHGVSVQTEKVLKDLPPAPYDEDKLATFLSRVCSSVVKELDKTNRSKAFANYRLPGTNKPDHVKEVYSLHATPMPPLENLKTSSVAWSCTGNVAAVGYATTKHSGLCFHPSYVNLYNTQVAKFDGKATRTIETESCVSKLAMHPYEPSIIAVGLHSGMLKIADLTREGSDVYFKISENHTDQITGLEWTNVHSSYHLVTSSLDGHMFIYKVSLAIRSVDLVEKYIFNEAEISPTPGVSAFAFSHHQVGVFVSGLEGGALYHCSVNLAVPKPPIKNLKNPVVKTFQKRLSYVTSIAFSPFLDDIFITAGADQHVLVHSLLQEVPLRTLASSFDIMGLNWSPALGNIFIAWGVTDTLLVCNYKQDDPLGELQPDSNSLPLPERIITCSAFCQKSPSLLAIGGVNGRAHIWEIPKLLNF